MLGSVGGRSHAKWERALPGAALVHVTQQGLVREAQLQDSLPDLHAILALRCVYGCVRAAQQLPNKNTAENDPFRYSWRSGA